MSIFEPKKIFSACKAILLDNCTVTPCGEDAETIRAFFSDRQIPCGADGNLTVTSQFCDTRELTYIEECRRVTDEKYILLVRQEESGLFAEIRHGGKRGLFYALCDLYRQIMRREVCARTAENYPLFRIRGYIEGFYGTPWKPQQRTEMLRLLAEHGMNTYFYAPKDDPYHRDRWQELYPEKELADLASLVRFAERNCVDFWFCIAPGLDIRYSDDEQFARLAAKCRQLFSIGVRRFGLLLDDIPTVLQHPQDAARYAEPVNAHIDLTNRLFETLRHMDAGAELVVCPTEYHGKADDYYISKLGRGIAPEIRLFWTGRSICSLELTVPEAVLFGEHTLHRPLYWDNFPVNDAEMVHEMHIGYLQGRDAQLYRYSEGLVANVMPQFESSKIPLLTVADYLWSPETYDPLCAWEDALDTVVGADADTFVYFAEHLLVSCLQADVSPRMVDALSLLRGIGDVKRIPLQFSEYVSHIRACCDLLQKRKGEKLYIELAPWIEKFFVFADTLFLCERYLTEKDPSLLSAMRDKLRLFERLPEVMTDFAFRAAAEAFIQYESEGDPG